MREKLARIRQYLKDHNYTGMVLARQDNFNWVTNGGNSRVIVPQDIGHAALAVTESQIFLTAQYMDCARILDEEIKNPKVQGISLYWYEQSPIEKAVELAGERVVIDCPVAGAEMKLRDIYDLHMPLTEEEYRRLQRAGALSDHILYEVAKEIKPGMIDYEVEAMMTYAFARENMQCDVALVGTDDRMSKYRHPNPCGRKIGKYVMIHAAARSGGLHSNVSRSIYFGDEVPGELASAYDTCCRIEAYCMSRCEPGTKWLDIQQGQKALYKELGFEEDWKFHYPGGRTGYFVSQSDLSLDPTREIQNREAYDWFVTATGAKVEELSIRWDDRFEILSHTGIWPSQEYRANGKVFDLPAIMLR